MRKARAALHSFGSQNAMENEQAGYDAQSDEITPPEIVFPNCNARDFPRRYRDRDWFCADRYSFVVLARQNL